jgi:hypothetical protein
LSIELPESPVCVGGRAHDPVPAVYFKGRWRSQRFFKGGFDQYAFMIDCGQYMDKRARIPVSVKVDQVFYGLDYEIISQTQNSDDHYQHQQSKPFKQPSNHVVPPFSRITSSAQTGKSRNGRRLGSAL